MESKIPAIMRKSMEHRHILLAAVATLEGSWEVKGGDMHAATAKQPPKTDFCPSFTIRYDIQLERLVSLGDYQCAVHESVR